MSISLVTRVACNAGTEAVPRHSCYIEVPLYIPKYNSVATNYEQVVITKHVEAITMFAVPLVE
jgi:hypothetical protein